jgi:ABC-type multidrug transport system fused ATPase/permease subunit
MEKATTIENLIEKAEVYGKTTFELCKYNTVYKSADIISSIAVKVVILLILVLFSLLLNIGFSLWIGEWLGKTYFGFFISAGLYLLIAFIVYLFRYRWIKNPISNFIINRMVKK